MINVNYYNNFINLTDTRTEEQVQRTYALATYFNSVEHIKEFCTYINYRNLVDIYEEH